MRREREPVRVEECEVLGQRIKKRRKTKRERKRCGSGTVRRSSWPEITNKTFTLRRAANRPGRTRCVSVYKNLVIGTLSPLIDTITHHATTLFVYISYTCEGTVFFEEGIILCADDSAACLVVSSLGVPVLLQSDTATDTAVTCSSRATRREKREKERKKEREREREKKGNFSQEYHVWYRMVSSVGEWIRFIVCRARTRGRE